MFPLRAAVPAAGAACRAASKSAARGLSDDRGSARRHGWRGWRFARCV